MNPYKDITNIKEKHYTDAQLALQKSLIELNQHHEIYNISVKELCKNSNVARSTFYSYYNNINDLQEEIENDLIYNLLKLNNDFVQNSIVSEQDLEFLGNTRDYILDNKITFYTFLITNPNIRFIKKWKKSIKYHFWENLFRNKTSINEKLILELIAAQAIAAFIFWLENPKDIDFKGINKLIFQILNTFK